MIILVSTLVKYLVLAGFLLFMIVCFATISFVLAMIGQAMDESDSWYNIFKKGGRDD